jgi:transcriptional regulator with XRE-family HTH domain
MTSQNGRAFNEWLRAQLKAKKMSQRQLAQQSGVDHSTISRLIRGDRTPSLATATRSRGPRELRDDTDTPVPGGLAEPIRRRASSTRSNRRTPERGPGPPDRIHLAVRMRFGRAPADRRSDPAITVTTMSNDPRWAVRRCRHRSRVGAVPTGSAASADTGRWIAREGVSGPLTQHTGVTIVLRVRVSGTANAGLWGPAFAYDNRRFTESPVLGASARVPASPRGRLLAPVDRDRATRRGLGPVDESERPASASPSASRSSAGRRNLEQQESHT